MPNTTVACGRPSYNKKTMGIQMNNTALAVALVLLPGAVSAADGFSLGTGFNYSTGDYGSDVTTEIISVPVTARLDSGNWSFRASLPWVHVSGDPNVLPGIGLVENLNPVGRGRPGLIDPLPPPDDQEPESSSASGIGDLSLSAFYTLPTGGPVYADLSLTAKIATADEEDALGTGANDYGVGLDVYRDFDGTMVFGGVGYTVLGDSRFIEADDVFSGNLGVSQRVSNRARVGLMFDYREATSSLFDDRQEVMAFLSRETKGGRVQLHASGGFSDGSPDWGAGVSFARSF
jgi:hypothetical protein